MPSAKHGEPKSPAASHAFNLPAQVGGRFAAALFNRSPKKDTITLQWSALNATHTASFAVRDIWAAKQMGSFAGSYAAQVPSRATVYLTLTPSSVPAAVVES